MNSSCSNLLKWDFSAAWSEMPKIAYALKSPIWCKTICTLWCCLTTHRLWSMNFQPLASGSSSWKVGGHPPHWLPHIVSSKPLRVGWGCTGEEIKTFKIIETNSRSGGECAIPEVHIRKAKGDGTDYAEDGWGRIEANPFLRLCKFFQLSFS